MNDARIARHVKIARLYYLEGLNQSDIARKMRTSVAGVSRSLAKARELGIVKISVQSPDRGIVQRELEIEQRFGLAECLLVDNSDSLEIVCADMANRLFEHLDRTMTDRSNLGVSWGRTLRNIADNLENRAGRCAAVIPVIGAVGRIETGIFPNSIAIRFAERLNGDGHLVNVPALVDSAGIRESLLADGSFAPVAALWRKLDIVLFSVSTLESGASVRDLNVMPSEVLDRAAADGADFMANFLFFDYDGKPVNTQVADRIIAIAPDDLLAVPHRIITAAGPEKTMAVLGALRAGLCNVLVTDVATAEAVLSSAKEDALAGA